MLKAFAKSAARSMGLELLRFDPAGSRTARVRAMLRTHGVNLVLDVGANVGQYALELRRHVGYRGRIVSFEPMRAAHDILMKTAAGDQAWEVAKRTAIGARRGSVTLNIAGNSVSSSVLRMLDVHALAAPGSAYAGEEDVELDTLDSVALSRIHGNDVAFLKIDTQGYESEVLKGAEQTLARVTGLQLELSLVPLYEGQLLMPELMAHAKRLGFDLWELSPAFVDPNTGRMLQVDATFFRTAGS